jgi:N-methylhydantoinase A
MTIDAAASARALEPIASRFGMTLEAAADSAVALANANVVRAIQLISTERGHDPRDYVLVPYGGAGPLHAAQVAAEIGIGTIVVPPSAGIISAYGLIASDFVLFESLTRRAPADETAADTLRSVFAAMRERALARARASGLEAKVQLTLTAEMRFVGQAFEVPVAFDEREIRRITAAGVRQRFGEAHHRVFFFGGEAEKPIEFVSFRLGLAAPLKELPLLAETETGSADERTIRLYDTKQWCDGRLRSRASLGVRDRIRGPALLEDPTSTLYVPAGWTARRDENDNTILERG